MSRKAGKKRKKSKTAGGRSVRPAAIGAKKNGAASIVLVSALAAIVFAVYYFSGAPENQARSIPSLGNRHIRVGTSSAVTYNTNPPTSGPHYPTIVRWGVHQRPIDRGFQVQ